MVLGEIVVLRRTLRGFEVGRTLDGLARVTLAAGALAGVAALVHPLLAGEGKLAQLLAVTGALAAGGAAYLAAVALLRVPEARMLRAALRRS
jgi:hypothetical protein